MASAPVPHKVPFEAHSLPGVSPAPLSILCVTAVSAKSTSAVTCSTMDCIPSPGKLEVAEEVGEGVFLEDKVEMGVVDTKMIVEVRKEVVLEEADPSLELVPIERVAVAERVWMGATDRVKADERE